jgi:hypothetical protein
MTEVFEAPFMEVRNACGSSQGNILLKLVSKTKFRGRAERDQVLSRAPTKIPRFILGILVGIIIS